MARNIKWKTSDYEPPDEYRKTCIELLMLNLRRHESFKEDIKSIRDNFKEIAQYSWHDIEPLASEQGKAYVNGLILIVNKYGLNPEWGLEHVHDEIKEFEFNLRVSISVRKTNPQECNIPWKPMILGNKSKVKEYIFQEFDKQWTEHEAYMEGIGYKKHHSSPQLETHIYWVFQHVCLKKTWKEIADNARVIAKKEKKKKVVTRNKKDAAKEKMYNEEDVKKTGLKIIEILELPHQKGGRPKK